MLNGCNINKNFFYARAIWLCFCFQNCVILQSNMTSTQMINMTSLSQTAARPVMIRDWHNGTTIPFDNVTSTLLYENNNMIHAGILDAVASVMNKYVYTLSSAIGIIANLIILFLMRRPPVRDTSFGVYFTGIACSDNVLLVHYLMNSLVMNDYKSYSEALCRIVTYIVTACEFFTYWCVCIVTFERAVAVMAPLKSKMYINFKNAIRIVLLVFGASLLLQSPYLWMYSVATGRCSAFYPESNKIGRWINTFLIYYLPGAIVIVCNVILLKALSKAKKIRNEMTKDKDKNKENYAPVALAIGLAYVLLVLPSSIYFSLQSVYQWHKTDTASLRVARATFRIVKILNHSCNLFFYVISSSRMRNQLSRAVCFMCGICRRSQTDNSMSDRSEEVESRREAQTGLSQK